MPNLGPVTFIAVHRSAQNDQTKMESADLDDLYFGSVGVAMKRVDGAFDAFALADWRVDESSAATAAVCTGAVPCSSLPVMLTRLR